ncbi:hypothetical protein [Nonomuraea cavernae]|uniref:hypothetical protein n=1 Tax=Nonomuraea cavernae TaxID=2045107 RepID=UPI00166AC14B|nr:hypothetical protein [Nonomuraea cavernae]MCA2186051.1 hypothetical protein [Nonomuraea cavernae]
MAAFIFDDAASYRLASTLTSTPWESSGGKTAAPRPWPPTGGTARMIRSADRLSTMAMIDRRSPRT